jgi:prophage regulatory protein
LTEADMNNLAELGTFGATRANETHAEAAAGWGAPGTPPAPPNVASAHPSYDRLMRLPEVLRLCSFSRSTLYDKIAKGLFPKQVRLGENIVAWYESEVLAWIRRPT